MRDSFPALARRVSDDLGQTRRYAHVVRVARLADLLAQAHRIDPRKARLAGMLHDLARPFNRQRLITECTVRRMPIDDFEAANPIVLHARLSAALANERYGVGDPDVLSAIEKHTVAAAAMSPLDCILYLADGLEPGRDFPERAELARLARVDLGAAMRETLVHNLRHLQAQGLAAAPQTLQAARTFGAAE
ncbi:MAG: bis(5'-nucleosyl)-tetraphosphatase (symmetrical) YqeK [Bacillati bacterium]